MLSLQRGGFSTTPFGIVVAVVLVSVILGPLRNKDVASAFVGAIQAAADGTLGHVLARMVQIFSGRVLELVVFPEPDFRRRVR